MGGLVATTSTALPGDASLAGSVFEIETDANIVVDTDTAGVDDWVEVPGSRIQDDEPTGTDDGDESSEDDA